MWEQRTSGYASMYVVGVAKLTLELLGLSTNENVSGALIGLLISPIPSAGGRRAL